MLPTALRHLREHVEHTARQPGAYGSRDSGVCCRLCGHLYGYDQKDPLWAKEGSDAAPHAPPLAGRCSPRRLGSGTATESEEKVDAGLRRLPCAHAATRAR